MPRLEDGGIVFPSADEELRGVYLADIEDGMNGDFDCTDRSGSVGPVIAAGFGRKNELNSVTPRTASEESGEHMCLKKPRGERRTVERQRELGSHQALAVMVRTELETDGQSWNPACVGGAGSGTCGESEPGTGVGAL